MTAIKNVYNIPASVPFLEQLVRFVLEGKFLSDALSDDPLRLANTTIYLPTRRAVRALRLEFSRQLGARASFLPMLRTFGDNDEDEVEQPRIVSNSSNPEQIVNPLYRQVQLARLVRHWARMMGHQTRELFEDEDIVIPSSTAEALKLSREVCDLIDQMGTEEISWESLKSLVSQKDQYAHWWQLTLDFLQIATKSWPEHLANYNLVDPAVGRRNLLVQRTSSLVANPPPGPVIAAGSTGSIPATARFLKAISQLPNGAVILPGLDMHLDDDSWEEISGRPLLSKASEKTGGCEGHPQFGLSRLIDLIGINRSDVVQLGDYLSEGQARGNLVSTALLPSSRTGIWRNWVVAFGEENLKAATKDITIVEAPAERQEAMAIALILREQIEQPDVRAALVTPDRNLARQVAAQLKRFSLEIDDSGGAPLANTPNSVFLRLMLSVATMPADAVVLAAFVKHPMLGGKVCPGEQSQPVASLPVARLFEICLLRNVLAVPEAGHFETSARQYHAGMKNESHLPKLVCDAGEGDWQDLFDFCHWLDEGLAPLLSLISSGQEVDISRYFALIRETGAGLTRTREGNSVLFQGEGGKLLDELLMDISNSSKADFGCRGGELLAVFDALIDGAIVRSSGATHPRISILGPLEARLQPLDCVVLGGLNEGSWPSQNNSGPFLSRVMKSQIELSTPERRVGLSAHDFEQLMGIKKVFLTHSERADNSPTIPSRWLQRLLVSCGATSAEEMRQRGVRYLNWVNQLDKPELPARRIERPCPKPAVIHRPTGLSFTEIETWVRDPYAIFAKRILGLLPMGELGVVPIYALRGTILHDGLAQYVGEGHDPVKGKSLEKLMEILSGKMDEKSIPAHMRAMWVPRFVEICDSFINDEIRHDANVFSKHCEIRGKMPVGENGFELRGRADRIDVLRDGSLRIIDYKTGTKPTAKMARSLSPQLALEGATAMAGGFCNLEAGLPASLEYIRLRAGGKYKNETVNDNESRNSAVELCQQKLKELEELIDAYNNPEQGYISRFAVMLSQNITGDYDHLARVSEWSWGNEEGDDEQVGGDYD